MVAWKTRLLALLSVIVSFLVYSILFPKIAMEPYLLLIPILSSIFYPSLALPTFLMVFYVALYRGGDVFVLLSILPFTLFYMVKNIHDWISAFVLFILPPIVILFPDFVGVTLGLIFYLTAKEKIHESFFTAIIFSSMLAVLSLLFIDSPSFHIPLLVLPGGLGRGGRSQISDAATFYWNLFALFASDPNLFVEFFILILALVAPSIADEKRLVTLILPQFLLLLIPLTINGSLASSDIFALAASIGTTLSLYSLEKTSFRITSVLLSLKNTFSRKNKRKQEYIDLGIIYWDLSDVVDNLRQLCTDLPRSKNIVIMGVTGEEERRFVEYALRGGSCNARIIFYHDIGADGLKSLSPDNTIVVYIRIPEKRTVVRILSRTTGFDEETTEKLALPYLYTLMNLSRVTLLRLGLKINEKIKEGASTRRAYDTTLRSFQPELSEEFVRTLEQVYMEYRVIGFAR